MPPKKKHRKAVAMKRRKAVKGKKKMNDPKTQWELFAFALESRNDNILIRGGSGTGKNNDIYDQLEKSNRDHLVLNMTAQTSKEDAYGHFIPNDKGFMEWLNMAVTSCITEGKVLVINEIDRCVNNGEAQDILLYICETPKSCRVTLPDGKNQVLRPQPGYRVLATMNGDFEDLPENILTRFPIKIDLGREFSPNALKALPDYARKLAKMYPTHPTVFSLRSLFPFVEAVEAGVKIETAVAMYFGAKFVEAISREVRLAKVRTGDDEKTAAA